MPMNLFRRRPSDLMSDPRMDDLREKALNRTSEDSMRAYGGGTGTSGVPVGTIMVEQPGQATRAMTGVGTPSIVRTLLRPASGGQAIGSEVVQPSDPSWTGEKVQTLMGEVSPEGRGRAAAVRTGSVAERLLGPSPVASVQSPVSSTQQPASPSGLFYDENHFQTSSTQPKSFQKLQAEYWTNKIFSDARAQRPGFSSLDEYDAWFRTIPGKPGEIGTAMKEAYLAGMPDNIKNEFMERKMQEGVNRREGQAVAPFNATSGLPPVQNKDQLDAAKAGQATRLAADEMAIRKAQEDRAAAQTAATETWDKQPIGEMNPVEGVPGWGFVKTSTGGGQLVELPEEKKIPFDGRKSFEEDGVLWTWSDRSSSYMGRPSKTKGFDVDPMIWLTMTPEQQQAMVTAFTSGKKPTADNADGADAKPPQAGSFAGQTAKNKKTGKVWKWNGKDWE